MTTLLFLLFMLIAVILFALGASALITYWQQRPPKTDKED
jgi:hypothetical protein